MKDPNYDLSRRDVLRAGTTSALLLGTGVAVSGTAAATGSTDIEFSDDCKKVTITNTKYSGKYTVEVLLENGKTVTRTRNVSAGKSRSLNFSRTIVKVRVKDEHGKVLGSAICPSVDIKFSDDCKKVTVTNSGYSGEYDIEVEFIDGKTVTRTRDNDAGKSRTLSLSRTIKKARVKIQGVVVGSAKCEVKEAKVKADIEFSDDCKKVTVTNTGYSGKYHVEVEFTNGKTVTRTRNNKAGKSRTLSFSRTIKKVRVKADGKVIGRARCKVKDDEDEKAKADIEFSDDCKKATVTNTGYSGKYHVEVEFTNGKTVTRTRNNKAGKSRTLSFSRTIKKVRVKADGKVIGSARCKPKDDKDDKDDKDHDHDWDDHDHDWEDWDEDDWKEWEEHMKEHHDWDDHDHDWNDWDDHDWKEREEHRHESRSMEKSRSNWKKYVDHDE